MATKKETIKPPTKKDTSAAGKALPKGSGPAGRVLADKSVAVRQGAAKPSPKKR